MSVLEAVKPAGDIAAGTVLVAVLADIITAIAALFTVIWYALRLYEKWTGLPFHKTPLVTWLKNRNKHD